MRATTVAGSSALRHLTGGVRQSWRFLAHRWPALWLALVIVASTAPSFAQPRSGAVAPTSGATAGASSVAAAGTAASAPTAPTAPSTTSTSGTSPNPSAAATAAPASTEPAPPTWGERFDTWWSGAVGLVFDKWSSPLFEANFWSTTLAGLRVVLPLLLAVCLLSQWVVERGHGRVPPRLTRRVALTFTIAGYLLHYGAFNPNVR